MAMRNQKLCPLVSLVFWKVRLTSSESPPQPVQSVITGLTPESLSHPLIEDIAIGTE